MTDSEIDKFLAETDAFDDFPFMNPPSLSPFLEETVAVADTTKSPIPSLSHPNQNLLMNNSEEQLLQHYSTTLPTYHPIQNLPSTNEIQSYQLPPSNIKYPLASNFNFETKLPTIGSSSKLANSFKQVLNHDREGVMSFLAGQVRPGPDVPQIYKREICSIWYPNANAYGGHVSFHSQMNKRKQELEDIEGGGFKKGKCVWITDTFSSSNRRIENEGNISIKMEKKYVQLKLEEDEGDDEDQKEIKWESDESVTSEFRVGDYIDIED